MLAKKRILLGICGGISAYKSTFLIRELRKLNVEIKVILTKNAEKFVTPITLQTLSQNQVYTHLFHDPMAHIELARWADCFLIVPATANVIAKLAHGISDDLLSTLYLACDKPIFIAPAMNKTMWLHSSTQRNIKQLKEDKVNFFMPDTGEQACGEFGPGRLQEPNDIIRTLCEFFDSKLSLSNKRIIITAGPTQEKIDPVRFISNYSSGKMGYALAETAKLRGADVLLISGPTHLSTPLGVEKISVTTAIEMHEAVMNSIHNCDIFIGNAAVADYRCENISEKKLEKNESLTLSLVKNPDILSDVSLLPKKPFVVGFAAQTDNIIEKARNKLLKKNLDLIFANQVDLPGNGFNCDTNSVIMISHNKTLTIPSLPKTELARRIWDLIEAAV